MSRFHRSGLRELSLALALALAACAAPPVKVDRLAGADLTSYRSFAIDLDLMEYAEPDYGPSARERARQALVEALLERGLVAVDDPAEADLLAAVGVATRTRLRGGGSVVVPRRAEVGSERSSLLTPLGEVPLGERRYTAYREGGVDAASPADEVRTRTVVVDLFDAATRRLVWRGTSRDPRSPEIVDLDDLDRRVRAIANQFP